MLIIAVFIGLAAALLVIAIWIYFGPTGTAHRERRMSERISGSSAQPTENLEKIIKKQRLSDIPALSAILRKRKSSQEISDLLKYARLGISVSTFLLLSLVFGILSFFFSSSFLPRLPSLAIGIAAALVPFAYVKMRHHLYQEQFVAKLPDGLSIISNALKVGHGLEPAFEAAAQAAPYPVSSEFQTVRAELKLGQPLPIALRNLYQRIKRIDVKIFVTGVTLHEELGGNLSEILDNLEQIIRERLSLYREIKALSAQGKLSAWILFAIPIALALLWLYFDPEALTGFANSQAGRNILYASGAIQAFAFFLIWQIVRLKD